MDSNLLGKEGTYRKRDYLGEKSTNWKRKGLPRRGRDYLAEEGIVFGMEGTSLCSMSLPWRHGNFLEEAETYLGGKSSMVGKGLCWRGRDFLRVEGPSL